MIRRHVIVLLLSVASLVLAVAHAAERPAGWRLASESSPYLQLHADNPVAWYPWGEAALEKARRENKPLFISVGYFTCHWCHVMARESFSDAAIAKLLNDHFVAIKIDREQRPDLDTAYMQYVQLTTGRGGWPMSVWATPDGEPFLGGTYYPPTSTPGQTGFSELLTRLAALWAEDEASIRETAQQAVALLTKVGRSAQPVELSRAPLEAARQEYRQTYDELQGGFGPAPKFPQPARLLFLLEDMEPDSRDMAVHTLARMIEGGIYDQLGGGFHRYSTDFDWRLPHFEKMLYDQALITRASLVAWRETRRPQFAAAAREVLDFSLRELAHADGGFYSALSADSPVTAGDDAHMEEGVFYTWTWAQLVAALGKGDLLDWAAARYDLFEQGNAAHDPLGEMEGRNVLAEVLGPEQLAARFKVDIATARQRNKQVDERLLRARTQRPAVPVDDKVVTVWNGYMITTLALAGRLLDEPRYIDAAVRSAEFLLDKLYDGKARILYRDWRNGVRGVAGFNEDYAALAEGLLALYRVSGERRWLQQATQLVDRQLELFWDETNGGFFNTTTGRADWLREKGIVDGATVSDNGMSIHVLLALARLGGQPVYRQRALQTAAWAMGQLSDSPSDMPYALRAWPALLAEVKNEKGSVTD